MQLNDFAVQFARLCFAFDREVKDGQMGVYFEFIGGFKIEALDYAVKKSILFHKYPRLPFISEIIDLMQEYRETIPAERQLNSEKYDPPSPETLAEFQAVKSKIIAKDFDGKAIDVMPAHAPSEDSTVDEGFSTDEKMCPHCKMSIALRNPSGFCDHLQYPEYCDICLNYKKEEKPLWFNKGAEGK